MGESPSRKNGQGLGDRHAKQVFGNVFYNFSKLDVYYYFHYYYKQYIFINTITHHKHE